jgi:hypothetical protein
MNSLLHAQACNSRPPPAAIRRLTVTPDGTRDAREADTLRFVMANEISKPTDDPLAPRNQLPAEICYGCVDWFPYASGATIDARPSPPRGN